MTPNTSSLSVPPTTRLRGIAAIALGSLMTAGSAVILSTGPDRLITFLFSYLVAFGLTAIACGVSLFRTGRLVAPLKWLMLVMVAGFVLLLWSLKDMLAKAA